MWSQLLKVLGCTELAFWPHKIPSKEMESTSIRGQIICKILITAVPSHQYYQIVTGKPVTTLGPLLAQTEKEPNLLVSWSNCCLPAGLLVTMKSLTVSVSCNIRSTCTIDSPQILETGVIPTWLQQETPLPKGRSFSSSTLNNYHMRVWWRRFELWNTF